MSATGGSAIWNANGQAWYYANGGTYSVYGAPYVLNYIGFAGGLGWAYGDQYNFAASAGGGVGGHSAQPFPLVSAPGATTFIAAVPGQGILGGSGGNNTYGNIIGYGNGAASYASYSGGAGAAGGYVEGWVVGLTPGANITITIGTGGGTSSGTAGAQGANGICIIEW
jgi:hypothetical protein